MALGYAFKKPLASDIFKSWPNAASKLSGVPFILVLVLLAGILLRHIVFDSDPYRCNALVTSGQWFKEDLRQWLVPGCSTAHYGRADVDVCTDKKKREIVIAGDIHLQSTYWAFAERVGFGNKWPSFEEKDLVFEKDHVQLRYFFDPYLNGSSLLSRIESQGNAPQDRPMLMVVGAANYAIDHNRTEEYIATVQSLASTAISPGSRSLHGSKIDYTSGPGDLLLFTPPQKPSMSSRADSDDEKNKKKLLPYDKLDESLRELSTTNTLDVLWSFAAMTNGQRQNVYQSNGVFVTSEVSHRRVDVLLNLRCNARRANTGAFPNLATCCGNWRAPNLLQTTFLVLSIAILPAIVSADFKYEILSDSSRPGVRALSAFTAVVAISYIADRTHVFEQVTRLPLNKFNLFSMIIIAGVIGILSIRRSKGPPPPRRPLPAASAAGVATAATSAASPPPPPPPPPPSQPFPFLPRDQTDEWKGWMQLLIIIYHYNMAFWYDEFWQIIRLCVSSYLFLTGFGHTVYFLQKRDFSLKRLVNVLIRTNLLPCTLAYVMRTNWLLYYYMPLSTFWFLIVYATLAIGQKYNHRTPFLLFKIAISAGLVHTFLSTKDLPETVVRFFVITCKMKFDTNEFFHHRVQVDQYIVYVGMVAAMLYIFLKDILSQQQQEEAESISILHDNDNENTKPHHQHPSSLSRSRSKGKTNLILHLWPLLKRLTILLSLLSLPLFFHATHTHLFRTHDQRPFATWQPYITFLPILSFTILRNAHPMLRSHHSTIFAWLGRYSGEMYVLQDHIWLAGDQQAVLRTGIFGAAGAGDETVWGDRWRDLIVVTVGYLVGCKIVGDATGGIAEWFVREEGGSGSSGSTSSSSSAAVWGRDGEGNKDEVEMGLLAGAAGSATRSSGGWEEEDEFDEIEIGREYGEKIGQRRSWLQRVAVQVLSIRLRLWPTKLKNRVVFVLAIMWLLNVTYT